MYPASLDITPGKSSIDAEYTKSLINNRSDVLFVAYRTLIFIYFQPLCYILNFPT